MFLQATQCGLFNCSCVFIDTGNVNNDVDTGNLTVDELVPICPNLTETVVDSCVQPPLEFPCNLRNIKYVKLSLTQPQLSSIYFKRFRKSARFYYYHF